jgi:hypothetical protein
MTLQNTSAGNRDQLLWMFEEATSVPPSYGPQVSPCAAIHNWRDDCVPTNLERIFQVMGFMAPVYGALHLIPAVLFRQKAFVRDPAKVLTRALAGTARSSFFLGIFVAIYQSLLCGKSNLYLLLAALRARAANTKAAAPLAARLGALVPERLQNSLVSKSSFWLLGFCAGTAASLEEPRRRAELALYVLPKALESAWAIARGKGYVRPMGVWGDVLLAGIGCGGLMGTYQNDPAHLGGLVRRVVYQFVGPN